MSERLKHALITPFRLLLSAIVYVRQSSAPQVRENWGSTKIQEEQVALARAYGWSDSLIRVLSGDLGKSGTGTAHRPAWQEMMELIPKRLVGAVFVWNVSRLSREMRDFEDLRVLCKVYDVVLVIDGKPADPKDPNDTVILQIQAVFAQLENHTRAQNMLASRRRKAREGKLVSRLPLGWIENPDGSFDFDPAVKPSIDDIVHTFWGVRSVLGTVRALADAGKKVPVRHGRKVRWVEPTARAIRQFLVHPAYRGTYCFGMSKNRPDLGYKLDGYAKRRPAPEAEWIIVENHHPAYISGADQERIKEILKENRFENRTRPGTGPGLCQGLLRCGRCGTTLCVQYPARSALRYRCQKNQTTYARRRCFDFKGDDLDAAMERIFLLVAGAPPVAALRKALEESRSALKTRQAQRQVEQRRLEYEVRVARDRYQECDPRNRLVAAHVEADLEKALQAMSDYEQRSKLEPVEPNAGDAEVELERLVALAHELPTVWAHPSVTMEERKDLLATLIDHVVVDVTDLSLECVIHWKSGCETPLRLWRREGRDQQIVVLHSEGLTARQIRERLQEGDPETGQCFRIGEGQIYAILKKRGLSVNPARTGRPPAKR